jgi:hypothetical protein
MTTVAARRWRRARAWLAGLLLSGCDPEGEVEGRRLAMLDRRYVESKELHDNIADRVAEQATVRERLARFDAWPDTARVLKALDEGAMLSSREPHGAIERWRLVAQLEPRACLAGALRVAQLGPAGVIQSVEARDGGCAVALAVLPLGAAPPAAMESGPPTFRSTVWCFSRCRERRERMLERWTQVEVLERSLGELTQLKAEHRRLFDLEAERRRLLRVEPHTVLERLVTAGWQTPLSLTVRARDLRLEREGVTCTALEGPWRCVADDRGVTLEPPR